VIREASSRKKGDPGKAHRAPQFECDPFLQENNSGPPSELLAGSTTAPLTTSYSQGSSFLPASTVPPLKSISDRFFFCKEKKKQTIFIRPLNYVPLLSVICSTPPRHCRLSLARTIFGDLSSTHKHMRVEALFQELLQPWRLA
jgi:hypothetical protein